jgi:hypothetical protein
MNKNEGKMSVERNIFAPFQLKLFVSDYYLVPVYYAVRLTHTNHPGVLLSM